MNEDPTVHAIQDLLASRFNKEAALFLPTGTMSNLTAVLGHCDKRGSEMIVGGRSHLCLYEGGNVSQHGGVHSRQIMVRKCYPLDMMVLPALRVCPRVF